MSAATPTTTTGQHRHSDPSVPAARPAYRVTFPHLLRAESIKFWSVRSSYWTLAVTLVVFVGIVALVSLVMKSNAGTQGPAGPEAAAMDGSELALVPFQVAVQMASLAVVILGAMSITSEYSTGMIRSSIAAAPKRLPVLWSKATVVGFVVLVSSAVVVALGALASKLILSADTLTLDLADSEVQRVLGGSVIYLTAITLFSFAFGALLRHTAAALASVLGLLLVLENVLQAIPWAPLQYVTPFLPASAGSRLTMTDATIDALNEMNTKGIDVSAWGGLGILAAWIVLLLALAAIRMRRSDA